MRLQQYLRSTTVRSTSVLFSEHHRRTDLGDGLNTLLFATCYRHDHTNNRCTLTDWFLIAPSSIHSTLDSSCKIARYQAAASLLRLPDLDADTVDLTNTANESLAVLISIEPSTL